MRAAAFPFVIALAQVAFSADTELVFNPRSPDIGPYPSGLLTVADPGQRTGRRVNLPMPAGCQFQPTTACTDSALLNELDGFSIEPRLRVCFSGPIAPNTLPDGVFVLGLHRPWEPISVERIFFDPATNCASARPASVLEPERNYALLITDRVRDAQGKSIKASSAFRDSANNGLGSEATALLNLIETVLGRGFPNLNRPVGITVFNTMSATDWIRQARAFVNQASTPSIVRAVGPPEGFPLAALTGFTWLAQTNANASVPLTPFPIPHNIPNVKNIAFGVYFSPNFRSQTPGPLAGTIPAIPTRKPLTPQVTPVVEPQYPGYVPVSFHVFLPSSLKPADGYPVVIYGHGLTDSQFGAPTAVASIFAQSGFATLAMEIPGHGFGPESKVRLTAGTGTVELKTPGRGISLSTSGDIGPIDGCILPGPFAARDCARQAAVDIFALVRGLRSSNGYFGQLDPSRIYYVGQSFGSVYGSLVSAFEPNIRASVMNVPGASTIDTVRLAQQRPLAVGYLAMRTPPLLNKPFGFPHPMNYDFDDNYVFRGRPALVNAVPGAPQIQDAFEVAEWLNMQASPLAFAPTLQSKRVLYQFAKGDEEVPNPTNSAFIRAAGGRTASRYLRFDLAKCVAGAQLAEQPHRFLANPEIFSSPGQLSIAMAAQRQIAGFFASNGASIPDANQFLTFPYLGVKLFETPVTLPDDLIVKPPCPLRP